MIDHSAIARDIAEVLRATPGANVLPIEATPENILAHIQRRNRPAGAMVVQYRGRRWSQFLCQGNPPSGQDARMSWAVVLAVRNSDSPAPAYPIMAAAADALNGMMVVEINDCPYHLFRESESFLGVDPQNSDLWIFESIYSVIYPEDTA